MGDDASPPASERSKYRHEYPRRGGGEPGFGEAANAVTAAVKKTTSSLSSSASKIFSGLSDASTTTSTTTTTSYWRPSGANVRWNTSLRPTPDVLPLVGVMAAGLSFVGIIVWHDLSSNHEVLIRKSARKIGVVDEGDETYANLTKLSKAHYDNGLRRYVLGYKPWIFSGFQEWITGISRKGARVRDDVMSARWYTIRTSVGPHSSAHSSGKSILVFFLCWFLSFFFGCMMILHNLFFFVFLPHPSPATIPGSSSSDPTVNLEEEKWKKHEEKHGKM